MTDTAATLVFTLAGEDFIELHKLLKVTGLCVSGGLAKALVDRGQVTVDGTLELRKRCKIRQGQTVEFNGCAIRVT